MISLNDLRDMKKDDLLKLVGLEERSVGIDVASSLALFGVGVLVGAGIGMLLAPKAGQELRSDLSGRIGNWTSKMGSAMNESSSASPTSSESSTSSMGGTI